VKGNRGSIPHIKAATGRGVEDTGTVRRECGSSWGPNGTPQEAGLSHLLDRHAMVEVTDLRVYG